MYTARAERWQTVITLLHKTSLQAFLHTYTDGATSYDTSYERALPRLHSDITSSAATALVCTQQGMQRDRLWYLSYMKRVCGLSSTLNTDDATSYDTSYKRTLPRLHSDITSSAATALVCTQGGLQGGRLWLLCYMRRVCRLSSTLNTDHATYQDTS